MAVKQLLTAEDVAALPDVPGKRFELVRGTLVEVSVAHAVHNLIVRLLFKLLDAFVEERDLGIVFRDGAGYIVARDPDVIRVPDVSFIAAAKLRNLATPAGSWPFAPDHAIEVISPNDRPEKVYAKVLEFLDGGSRLIWVLWPDRRAVSVHAADGTTRQLEPGDELDGGVVLAGFCVPVADLFSPMG